MTINCIHQVALECTTGTSDKLYIIQVQEDLSGASPVYLTKGYSGRRGASLVEQPKYSGPSKASAMAEANKVERDKRSGSSRYNTLASAVVGVAISGMPASAPIFTGAPASGASAPAAAAFLGMALSLSRAATDEEARIAHEKDWAMQPDFSGRRCAVSLRRSGIQFYDRMGRAFSTGAVLEKEFKPLLAFADFNDERETILDGVMIGDTFTAFDLLMLRDNGLQNQPFIERFTSLEMLLESMPGLLAPTAWTEEERTALSARVASEAWEGLILRDLDALYQPGGSDAALRVSPWATCCCRVLTVNSKRGVQLGVLDGKGNEIGVGTVTVPVYETLPDAYDLVEVRYLHVSAAGQLEQPQIVGVRADDGSDECDALTTLRQAPEGLAADVTDEEAKGASASSADPVSVSRAGVGLSALLGGTVFLPGLGGVGSTEAAEIMGAVIDKLDEIADL